MWQGAVEAYSSNNSDRVRHFSVSIRELLTHLMHKLATNKDIKAWTEDENMYDAKKNPTREARLLYICRNISNDELNKFIKKDIETTGAFIRLFQEGTHSVEPNFTENQLRAIKSKAEHTLKFLLEIEFGTNNK